MKSIVSLAICLAIFLAVTLGLAHRELLLALPTGTDVMFEITPGTTLLTVSERLDQAGLLPATPIVFRAFARATRYRGAIKIGEYRLVSGMDSYDLLQQFRAGKVYQHRVTFPEGLSLVAWRSILAREAGLQHELAAMSDQEIVAALGVDGLLPGESLLNQAPEGWFFPDTYLYVKGDSDLSVLGKAHVKMQQVLAQEWAQRETAGSLSGPYEALILASMIEKETGHEPDRVVIASVFHNRLKRGMRLQSDPTVIYGLGKEFTGDLRRRHLTTDGPFNTYTRHGLPPTPICSPGRASIKAALSPLATDYLYFVAKGNGESYFSRTLSEHNLAVRRYQLSEAGL